MLLSTSVKFERRTPSAPFLPRVLENDVLLPLLKSQLSLPKRGKHHFRTSRPPTLCSKSDRDRPIDRTTMVSRSGSLQTKGEGVLVIADVHDACSVASVMVVPKEIQITEKHHGAARSRTDLMFRGPDVKKAFKNVLARREVGEFLSGALAGAMAKAVLAPLETIRTRMVVGVGSKNIAGSFVEIIGQNGWRGLWAGNAVNMLRIIPSQAIELATFESVKRAVISAQSKRDSKEDGKLQTGVLNLAFSLSWISPVAVGGAAAGIASTLTCHPLEVLKDRLTVNREAYPSLTVAFNKICRDEGIGGLYSGLAPTLVGMLPYSTCYYFIYDTIKKSYCRSKKKSSLNRAELMLVGAFSGFTASTISFPLEVARKRLMVGSLQGKCPTNMVAALSEVVKEEGLRGLYRGWGASCLKVIPNSGITWVFYEAWKDVLVVGRHPL